jgi:hypothetical protein
VDERLLYGVFSVVVGQQRPTMPMQAPPVAIDDRRERGIAAALRERNQDSVGLRAQPRP